MTVEVVFALPDHQVLKSVTLAAGATVQDAIAASGIAAEFPGENLIALPAGIWGRAVARECPLADGDRVEIYRPLEIEPREARRIRAKDRVPGPRGSR